MRRVRYPRQHSGWLQTKSVNAPGSNSPTICHHDPQVRDGVYTEPGLRSVSLVRGCIPSGNFPRFGKGLLR